MRKIDIDEDVYRYLVSHTRDFGETPSDVLRRLLGLLPAPAETAPAEEPRAEQASSPAARPAVPPPPPPATPEAAKPPPEPSPKPAAPGHTPPAPSPKSDEPGQTATAPSEPPAAPAPKPPPPTPKPAEPPPRPPSPAKEPKPGPAKDSEPEPAPDVQDPKRALIAFLSSPKVMDANATTRYLEILGYLSEDRPRDFEEILDMGGRTRRYFGKSKREIEESGKSTAPREIPGSRYWAMTGVDTFQKRDILRQAMERMKYDADSVDRCVEAVK
jgi:negative regulator of replication initiation